MEYDIPQHLHIDKEQGINKKHQEQIKVKSPPFPKILTLYKPIIYSPEFYVLEELRNICVKIPLL